MLKQMSELAKECMNELDIIRQAQDDLNNELDRIWVEIDHSIQDEIKEMTGNLTMPMRPNDSTPGHYRSVPDYRNRNENLPRITIEVHDPRDSEVKNQYRIRLFWSGTDRKQLFKNSTGAQQRLEELAKTENVQLLQPTERDCSEKFVVVAPDKLDETATQVSETIISYYRLVTEFLKWLQQDPKIAVPQKSVSERAHK